MPCNPQIEAIVSPQFAIIINEAFQVLDCLEKDIFYLFARSISASFLLMGYRQQTHLLQQDPLVPPSISDLSGCSLCPTLHKQVEKKEAFKLGWAYCL